VVVNVVVGTVTVVVGELDEVDTVSVLVVALGDVDMDVVLIS
jgi:hypothetical protein